jgi:hypothetical protein
MTWPASDVTTTNLDAGSDNAATARADLLDLAQKFNQLRNHVSTFMQGALLWADVAAARLALGISNHEKIAVDSSGNLAVTGTITATGNISAYSDERLKHTWHALPGDLVARLASVRSGTYSLYDRETRYVGVSAQSLQRVLPDAVQTDEEGYLSVAYGQAALAACVALAQEVVALRGEVVRLREGR